MNGKKNYKEKNNNMYWGQTLTIVLRDLEFVLRDLDFDLRDLNLVGGGDMDQRFAVQSAM